MKLSRKVVRHLAEMVCGAHGTGNGFDWKGFPYRSAGRLVEFFEDCGLEGFESGGTRQPSVQEFLDKLNDRPAANPNLPSEGIVAVLNELMRPDNFIAGRMSSTDDLDFNEALGGLNGVLARDGLKVVPTDDAGVVVQHTESKATSEPIVGTPTRAWSAEEHVKRTRLAAHLQKLSEDEFTENVLVPILTQASFVRISVAGHLDKALEYGKDVWMRYRLPTGHWLYFAIQAKIGKVDSSGRSTSNVSELLNQARMALGHEIFDPELNKNVLVDHVYLATSGTITKAAKNWIGQRMDRESRRSIMFLDREDVLNLALLTNAHLPGFAPESEKPVNGSDGDDIPF